MAEAFGWTPEQVGRLTFPQIRMFQQKAEAVGREDDWSGFGLRKDPKNPRRLIGPMACLTAYANHRKKLEASRG